MLTKVPEQYKKWGVVTIVVLFSIFILYLNLLYPFFSGDDYIFQLKIPDDGIIGTERVRTLSDLFESQINFYNNYHYRIINHTVLQAVLMLPYWCFDILNVVVLLLLPWVILKVDPKMKDYALKYLLILLFIWIFHFSLGWCYWPVTGALNYTWMLVPQIWYLVLLLQFREGRTPNVYLLLFLAFLNCMANENVAVTLLVLTLLVAIETRKDRTSVLWFCGGIILIGGIFMLNSPSIPKRLATQGHREAGLLSHLLEYFRRTGYYFIRYIPLALLLIITKGRSIRKTVSSYYIALALILATGIMIIVPLFEPRSAVFGFFIFLLLVVQLSSGEEVRLTPSIFILAVAVALAFIRLPAFQKQYQRNIKNESLLEKARGAQEVYLDKYCDNTHRDYLLCHEISEDPEYFDNQTLAAFFDIDEVKLNSEFIDANRRRKIFRLLLEDESYLTKLKTLESKEGRSLYIDDEGDKLDLLIRQTKNKNPFYIIRGKRKHSVKHFLASLLPLNIQIYFLDYLEDTTKRQQETIEHNGAYFNYDFILDLSSYDYFIISEYSFEDHAPIGEYFILKEDDWR